MPFSRLPRPATYVENGEITKIRQVQETIRQRAGNSRLLSVADLLFILVVNVGSDVQTFPRTFRLAINTMDEGLETGVWNAGDISKNVEVTKQSSKVEFQTVSRSNNLSLAQ